MMKRTTWNVTAMVLVFGAAAALRAADDKPTITDSAKAGPDFAVQGEYVGEITVGGKAAPYGAQVIADGDGKFALVVYQGGLPGEGWKRGDKRMRASGERSENVATFKGDGLNATIRDGVLTVTAGDSTGKLKKVDRKSKTLGAKAPEGAVVLFDGKSGDHFQGATVTEDGLLMAGTETKKKFGDHTLHIEFRTPFKPHGRGQDRGNSGVYVQNRYEVQVLDSFGLEGENNECGGIYSISKPIVNMCYPPLSWQTYDIDFTAARYNEKGEKTTNARVTIRHNGVVIHDNLELTHGTPGKNKEAAGPDGIYLQGHGNPVAFRNIWVVEK